MPKLGKIPLLLIQVAFYAILIWFIGRHWHELSSSFNPRLLVDQPFLVSLSGLAFLSFYALMSIHWQYCCRQNTKHIQGRQWLAFFASQPYKYLPSSIFTFSARAVYARKLGLPLRPSTFVQMVENLNILVSGVGLAIISLAYTVSLQLGLLCTILGCLVLVAGSFIPEVQIPKTAYKISGRQWVKLFLLATGGWIMAGTAFYCLARASGQSILFSRAIAANALAMTLGILAVFAPGGIGVREFVYAKFNLSNSSIVMWRILTFLADVILGTIAILVIRRQPNHN